MKRLVGVLMVVAMVVLAVAAVTKGATTLPYPMNALPIIVAVQAIAFSGFFYRIVRNKKGRR